MGEPFIRSVRLESSGIDTAVYPFTLPVVRHLAAHEWRLDAGVTFLIGQNGSGKSTLVEAVAVAAGMNAEGGGRNFAFARHPTESELHRHLTLVRGPHRPRTDFFLRAESFFNVATELERMGPEGLAAYGGRSLHHQSHGESFLALANHRFGPDGLYVLDEPEAALSVRGQMALLRILHDLAAHGAQLLVATHSPVLLACPGAAIHAVTDAGLQPTPYRECEPYTLTRAFLEAPERFLRHLLADD